MLNISENGPQHSCCVLSSSLDVEVDMGSHVIRHAGSFL